MPTTHPTSLWQDLFKRKASRRPQLVELLSQNILFSHLKPSELRYLASIVHERAYESHETIFHQNDRGLGVYLIAKGRVAITSHLQAQTIEKENLITVLEPGSFFGELALVNSDCLRAASAIALESTQLIGFFKPDLQEIMDRRPAMGVKILLQLSAVLGTRLLEATEKLTLVSGGQGVA